MPLPAGVVVEVDMWIQILSVQVFMRSAACVFRMVEQFWDTRDAAHQFQKFVPPNHLVEARVCTAQPGGLGIHCFASRFARSLMARSASKAGNSFINRRQNSGSRK